MKKFSRKICNFYAHRIIDLEKELEATTDAERATQIKWEIESIVDKIAAEYPPDSMYRIDEKIYSIIALEQAATQSKEEEK